MIKGNDDKGYRLVCDHCEEEVMKTFETFSDAVAFKKARAWKSIKGSSGWFELCPACAKMEHVVEEYYNK